MIVTRSWLEEYIDLSDVDNSTIDKRLNSIGLEVDSLEEHRIDKRVVVGEILSCQKHPNADKLNVCEVNIGDDVVQIICGAANVVDAKYVAVATIGAVLPGNFKIKKAKLRGIESFGMICSSSELDLPQLEDGIMILDESIGELIVGKPLSDYPTVADTVIDIELTANRGDCDSIRGMARDLAAAFKKDMKPFVFEPKKRSVVGIAKQLQVHCSDDIPATLEYSIVESEVVKSNFLQRLRLAFAKKEASEGIETLLTYAQHESGVLLRAYDFEKLQENQEKAITLDVTLSSDSTVRVLHNERVVSIVGVSQAKEFKADNKSKKVLLEAAYIEPVFVVEGVCANGLESDTLYYNSARGSEPDVAFGMQKLQEAISAANDATFSSTEVCIGEKRGSRKISIRLSDIIAIIGNDIAKNEIVNILLRLNFGMQKVDDDIYGVTIPPYRHDIINIQDITEEVLRLYGIDAVEAVPLRFTEQNRITDTYKKYKSTRDIRDRAVGANFYEVLTYIFANKELLQKYGFELVDEELELLNPIVKELNTLRTTILVNLLETAARNVKYGKKRIALFEIGTVFDAKRNEKELLSFLVSGEQCRANVHNNASSKMVDLKDFVEHIGSVIGAFTLEPLAPKNKLMHPHISALVIKDGESIGYLAKLHPQVADEFGLSDTFIAEISLQSVLSKHINAQALSNFQAVNKDLSILIDKDRGFYQVAKVLQELKEQEPLLKDFYPLDLYEDESLGNQKSLTVRFTLQSQSETLSDTQIEEVMSSALKTLEKKLGAILR